MRAAWGFIIRRGGLLLGTARGHSPRAMPAWSANPFLGSGGCRGAGLRVLVLKGECGRGP